MSGDARKGPRRRRDRTADSLGAGDFSQRLRRWFRRRGRDLPWRRTRDPYAVLISELMLQQTQVVRVLDFYERFLARFPDFRSVASASVREVESRWDGLGYYARARNLHGLARWVMTDGNGMLPDEPARLRQLPGIGPYTAGAVASFAFERRAALVDTNVARVLRRYFAPRLRGKRGRSSRAVWEIAEAILPRTGGATWAHNQALMELGALVCTAREKRCAICPVARGCPSRRHPLSLA